MTKEDLILFLPSNLRTTPHDGEFILHDIKTRSTDAAKYVFKVWCVNTEPNFFWYVPFRCSDESTGVVDFERPSCFYIDSDLTNNSEILYFKHYDTKWIDINSITQWSQESIEDQIGYLRQIRCSYEMEKILSEGS